MLKIIELLERFPSYRIYRNTHEITIIACGSSGKQIKIIDKNTDKVLSQLHAYCEYENII